MTNTAEKVVFDYVVIGSGFGGSVSAMRLAEKGYTVLVLERGKRYEDKDLPKTNWNLPKSLWVPFLRCFGIWQLSLFRHVLALHWSAVGGGSIGYANVLVQPSDQLFNNPSWKHLADWKTILSPHYETARRMLGVTRNTRLWPADQIVQEITVELGTQDTFQPTEVGVFFGEPGKEGQEVPDPYFNGEGIPRSGCTHCGACMVGCRVNSKNTLMKNYLYFAEKWGAKIWEKCEVRDVRPLPERQPDGARYEVVYRNPTQWLIKPEHKVRARNVIFSAGTLGTLGLLFRCRDVTKSLPNISPCLGYLVRTNSESLVGATSRNWKTDYSKGIAITSIFDVDKVTTVEPVRFPAGSSLLRFLAGPLIETGGGVLSHIWRTIVEIVLHPIEAMLTYIFPGWAQRTTIFLVMQTEDNCIHIRLGRHLFTLFRKSLVTLPDEKQSIPTKIDIGHKIARRFAEKINGIPAGSLNESLLNIPITAHILGGCPFGRDAKEGVVDLNCQIHNHPGLYVIDGSIMPGNPGVNPSLTITALAEYAMSCVPPKEGTLTQQAFASQPPSQA